ncbi:amidinotransferase [Streptomyces xanthophaeus]|uniref:amidinotransferase n=1 Tax=Streptomyces xanthophaeus TaxID=67385 RepID=UPI000AFCDDA9|nr:amidinotransferase [Streptomyces xanthophaeus]
MTGIVSSFTEWDPLEEVVVGRLDGAVFPTWQDSMADILPPGAEQLFRDHGGSPMPREHLAAAVAELDNFAEVLRSEGITVVRPDVLPQDTELRTPGWSTPGGLYAAMPRDHLMVVGDTIVEAPMSWRCRSFEGDAFRGLVKSYFQRGAKWLPAPRPQLTDELWRTERGPDSRGEDWAITEFEPVFDAADFMRFGDDIVVQRSHVTNQFGIDWLRRSVGKEFTVSVIEVNDPHAMHIDATLAPLAPGKLLVHPERFVPNKLFNDWETRPAPQPTLPADWPMYFCSPWVSMNVLSLDPQTVVVESHELPLIEALTSWGLRCVPVDFRHVYSFGGSFHCVTLDVRRSGASMKYLNS